MDGADATLVAIAEGTGLARVFTIDRRGLGPYRTRGNVRARGRPPVSPPARGNAPASPTVLDSRGNEKEVPMLTYLILSWFFGAAVLTSVLIVMAIEGELKTQKSR